MRITITTLGTRGDIQPYVALGLGLQRAGHRVRLATWPRAREFVTAYGLDQADLYQPPRQVLVASGASSWLAAGRHTLQALGQYLESAGEAMTRSLADCLAACQDADVIVTSAITAPLAVQVAEALGRPCYPAYYLNMIRTRAYPSSLLPFFIDNPAYNWLSYSLVDDAAWRVLRPHYNTARRAVFGSAAPLQRDQPLTALWRQRQPHLYGFSPAVLPRAPEWGDWVHPTGYWFLDRPADWRPPAALVDFLAAGPAPVYIGFGSMPHPDAEQLTRLVLKALALCGQRAILAAGWGGLGGASELPPRVFAINEAPHDWLFPRMRAVVHHGGAGTTAAGLRAGVPVVIIPFSYDQPFWGHRLEQLGAGPQPIARAALTAEGLAEAIFTACSSTPIRAAAAALGQKIRAEDGVARAVEIFHRYPAKVPAVQPRTLGYGAQKLRASKPG